MNTPTELREYYIRPRYTRPRTRVRAHYDLDPTLRHCGVKKQHMTSTRTLVITVVIFQFPSTSPSPVKLSNSHRTYHKCLLTENQCLDGKLIWPAPIRPCYFSSLSGFRSAVLEIAIYKNVASEPCSTASYLLSAV